MDNLFSNYYTNADIINELQEIKLILIAILILQIIKIVIPIIKKNNDPLKQLNNKDKSIYYFEKD